MLITNLDPPRDPHRDMLAICKTDWEPGVLIDDLFYELKEAAIRSQTPMKLACVVLISQLPPSVQNVMKDWIAEIGEVDTVQARTFISKVKETQRERHTLG